MPNHDQVNLRYYGLINSEHSHEATQYRVHWICKQASGQKVLDIGCSQGITSILLGREGFQVTGIDIEEASIQYANEELRKESQLIRDKVKFLLYDASTMDHKIGVFDTVILGEVLEHFSHPHKLLKNVYRLLQERGKVIITVPFGYHPFYDHKQTFYIGNLAHLLEPYFEEIKLEVHFKYICYVGQKRKRISSLNECHFTASQLRKWIELDEHHFLLAERKNEKILRERKQRLDQKENRMKELQKLLDSKNQEIEYMKMQLIKLNRGTII